MLPGDLFSRERLIRSYQNVANLGFFQQPLPAARREAGGERRRRRHRVPGRGAPHRQHQLRRFAGAGNRGRRLPRPGGAQPFRPGKAGQAAVAVRQEHQRLHPELHRPGHPGEPDLGHGLPVRLPGPVHRRRPGPAEADRRQPSARLPLPGIALYPAVHLVLVSADPLQRRLGRPSGALPLQRLHPLDPSGASLLRDTRVGLPFATGGVLPTSAAS